LEVLKSMPWSTAVVPNLVWLGATITWLQGMRGHKDVYNLIERKEYI